MQDLKLKHLLSLAAGLLLAVSLVAGVFAWHKFEDIARAGVDRADAVKAVIELKNIRFHVVQIQQFLTDVGATHDPGGFDEARTNLDEAHAALGRLAGVAPSFARHRAAVTDKLDRLYAVGVEMAQAYVAHGMQAGNGIMKRPDTGLDDASASLASELDELAGAIENDYAAAEAAAARATGAVRASVEAALFVLSLAALALMALVYQRVLPPLRQLQTALETLRTDSSADTRLTGLRADFRDVACAFNAILDAQEARRFAEEAAAAENQRVVEALDNVHSQVMLVDAQFDILYLNRTLKRCFAQFAGAARHAWPDFDPQALVGVNAARFHAEAFNRLAGEGNACDTSFSFAGRSFHVSANPVMGAGGARLGTVLEWTDLTEQQDAEGQIENMIAAAVSGELGRRLDLDRFDAGFLQRLAGGINRMLDTMVEPLRRTMDYVDQLARGEIPAAVEADWQGELARLKQNLNRCTDAVQRLVSDAERLAQAGVAGALHTRADAGAHAGAFRQVVEGVNATLDAIVRPIDECRRVFTCMAEGDLTGRMAGEYRGDFAVMRDALHGSLEHLAGTVVAIRDVTESLKTASSEIATGNWDLSQRTEEQGHNVERTTANVRELAQTVRQNADHTSAATQLATSAREQAVRGGDVVERAVAAMGDINDASARIADIIGVIDDLAFQTNLLALNAAVEAARAGEQGRGFAVVASEVRNLAQRSAEAAREIKTLIANSVERVGEGVRLVNESGASLHGIVTAVKQVDELIASIAAASGQQRAGIDEVAGAITRIDEGTQQNAALVEETAAASRMLSEQAAQVQTLVANLRTTAAARQHASAA